MKTKTPVGISACLLGQSVRYDGGHKKSALCVDYLSKVFEFSPICPEVAVGLGVPRETLTLVGGDSQVRAVGSVTKTLDVTDELAHYACEVNQGYAYLCGYILKEKSPSCALESAKMYRQGVLVSESSRGIFATALSDLQPHLPMIEVGQLRDKDVRENFIERVFAYSDWRQTVLVDRSMSALIEFHSRNKYLVMAHSYANYKALGRIVANAERRSIKELCDLYLRVFVMTLSTPAERKGHVNVLYHLMGYLKDTLPAETRRSLAATVDAYRLEQEALEEPLRLIFQHIAAHGSDYIRSQTYWQRALLPEMA